MLAEASPETIEVMMREARAHLQNARLSDAEAVCQRILQTAADNIDAMYTLAVSQRMQRQVPAALKTLDSLIAIDASYGRAWQERGHCFRDRGLHEQAIAAYQRAVTHNGALVASWRILSEMHGSAGREGPANFAHAQYAHLSALPPELLSVASFIQEGRIYKAEQLCRAFLQRNGHHVEAMRLLADIGMKFNAYDEAEFLLESAKVLAPDNVSAHFDYVKVLRKRQKFELALSEAAELREKEPDNPEFEMLYANENLAVGNFDAAMLIYEALLSSMPNNPGINLTYGHALKTVGRQDDAISAYRRAYQVRPDCGDAYWSLANLKTYRFDDPEIAQMRERQASAMTALEDRYHLCFALGKALEDRGDYGASFEYYELGNRLKREELKYNPARLTNEMRLQRELVSTDLLNRFSGAGCPAPDPIFIVGLPRAGSTLLEQILASHSQVEGTMELPNIFALAFRLDRRRVVGEEPEYPGSLADLTHEDVTRFGEEFIRDTQIYRKGGSPFFIDKMPNNFRHIGLIHMILPNAKIIDARRGAMGCCFSGFKQLFAEGQEFTYGLQEIGQYYSDYVRLMDHWDTVLPGKILRVRYEDVVADLETQVRRLLDHCGLPFEEACLNFHQNERAVRTASSEQVRQPIFKSGVDQWENFSSYLDPLRDVLGPELAAT
ncbi:tetratricopeptide repeat-containing sulfotransferase family protein [Sphingorhabdus sp.]|uniref:tetratricopeptide repeat-containing sulfotransferase family protein n=1 Tax=Sphingorhabdus sp. TaxID=1902408 RepID=UPI0026334CE7|nr:tetratricopeptide repeat-containing sulfotransferase family protein [Sphingorhabdus sp.]MDH4398893.1 sulfotransferase [Sphingorhabdus sp.]